MKSFNFPVITIIYNIYCVFYTTQKKTETQHTRHETPNRSCSNLYKNVDGA